MAAPKVSVLHIDHTGQVMYNANGSLKYIEIDRTLLPSDACDVSYALQDLGPGFEGQVKLVQYEMQEPAQTTQPTPTTKSFKPPFSLTSTSSTTTTSTTDTNQDQPEKQDSNNNFTWTHSATVLLIESYRKCKHLLDNSAVKKAEVFRRVAAELSEHGYTATHQDCLVKMKNLTSRFKIISESHSKTGRGRQQWPYLALMTQLLEGDPSVKPVSTMSTLAPSSVQTDKASKTASNQSRQTVATSNQSSQAVVTSNNSDSPTPLPAKKDKQQQKAKLADMITTFVDEQRKANARMLEMHQKVIEVAQERNNLLKRFLEQSMPRRED